jgi:hypothetical protein
METKKRVFYKVLLSEGGKDLKKNHLKIQKKNKNGK